MLILALLLVQSSPDVELNVHATVREVRIRQRGEASLQVHASPDAGSTVDSQSPGASRRVVARGATVNVHAEARIADPTTNLPAAETSRPNQR